MIKYYRGNVTNNNVNFAGYCWKIIRTTEKGGTKLLYNGKPDSNGVCTNTGNDSLLTATTFNINSNNLTKYDNVEDVENSVDNSKSIEELAKEVIAGKYGNGQERKDKLGGLYNEVQAKVNSI